MLQVDYMHAQRMRLDYIIGNREFSKKYGSCVNAHTMQSACSEILSDHLPILLTFKTNIGGNGGRSANNKKETLLKKIRCDEHRKMENQLKSCSWKTLCKWKEDWKRMKQMLEVERQNLCAANQRKWDGEERGQNREYPMGAEDWWYAPVKNPVAGKSCDSTCESIFDKPQSSDNVGKMPNLYDEPGKIYEKSYCDGRKLKAIDTCDRLKVAFDCLYGCVEEEGPDQPSYVGVESDKNFGYCLHNPKKSMVRVQGIITLRQDYARAVLQSSPSIRVVKVNRAQRFVIGRMPFAWSHSFAF